MSRIRLGISACLLGQRVRYDGRIKSLAVVVNQLNLLVSLLPVCPELECGLQVPREAIQLEDDLKNPRLRTVHSRRDLTTQLASWSARRIALLKRAQLDGYIFKSKSPSCGLVDTPVFSGDGQILGHDAGLYARALKAQFPGLALCDEKALQDPRRWHDFVTQITDSWIARKGPGENTSLAGEGAAESSIEDTRDSLLSIAKIQ